MPAATAPATPIEETELPGMIATLCSYESWFGPYHPQTLALTVQVAIAYGRAGELILARRLSERVVRDLERHLGRDHDLRMSAMAALRDILIAQRDYERAGEIQFEFLECQIRRLGREHPETMAARASLATILLEKAGSGTRAV